MTAAVIVVAVAWTAVALLIGVVIGRGIRHADQQKPRQIIDVYAGDAPLCRVNVPAGELITHGAITQLGETLLLDLDARHEHRRGRP